MTKRAHQRVTPLRPDSYTKSERGSERCFTNPSGQRPDKQPYYGHLVITEEMYGTKLPGTSIEAFQAQARIWRGSSSSTWIA